MLKVSDDSEPINGYTNKQANKNLGAVVVLVLGVGVYVGVLVVRTPFFA